MQEVTLAKVAHAIAEAVVATAIGMFAALPAVAGHPTGGAVDVTILRAGVALDMGTGYGDWASPLIYTYAEGLPPAQAANRSSLIWIQQQVADRWLWFGHGLLIRALSGRSLCMVLGCGGSVPLFEPALPP
jgi:hypothetical protein